MTAQPWTPDQPLRADATDKQMGDRHVWLFNQQYKFAGESHLAILLARELAAACVAAHPDSARMDWLEDEGELYTEIQGYDCDHRHEWRYSEDGPSLREFIDAARSVPEGNP